MEFETRDKITVLHSQNTRNKFNGLDKENLSPGEQLRLNDQERSSAVSALWVRKLQRTKPKPYIETGQGYNFVKNSSFVVTRKLVFLYQQNRNTMDESTYGKTPAIFPANPEYRPFSTIFPPPRAAYIIKVKNNSTFFFCFCSDS